MGLFVSYLFSSLACLSVTVVVVVVVVVEGDHLGDLGIDVRIK
jgi:hypothetical protein